MKYLTEINGTFVKIGEGGYYNPVLEIPIREEISITEMLTENDTPSNSVTISLVFLLIDRGQNFAIYKFNGYKI